jgi:hypothetical protein
MEARADGLRACPLTRKGARYNENRQESRKRRVGKIKEPEYSGSKLNKNILTITNTNQLITNQLVYEMFRSYRLPGLGTDWLSKRRCGSVL